MNILEFLQSEGITTRAKNQSEYSSPCLVCGGNDRFQSWPEKNRWYCRGCNKSGDLIELVQFCKALSFPEACRFIGEEWRISNDRSPNSAPESGKRESHKQHQAWKPKPVEAISAGWLEKTKALIDWSHEQLLSNPEQLKWLQIGRGINDETVKRFKLGWNPKDLFRERRAWGLPEELNPKTGKPKKLFIPAGLVIPGRDSAGCINLVKIRRPDPPEGQARYYFLPGGAVAPCFFGDNLGSLIVVESELDAVLLAQESGGILAAVSTGSATNRPDSKSFEILSQADHLIISLDNDDAGGKAGVNFWPDTFKSSRPWFVPATHGKDHTAAFLSGFPIGGWLKGILGIMAKKPSVDSAENDLEARHESKNEVFDSELVESKTCPSQATESQSSPLPGTSTGQNDVAESELLIVQAVRLASLSGEADQLQLNRALSTLDTCKAGTDDYHFALSVLVAAIEDAAAHLPKSKRRLVAWPTAQNTRR